MQPVLIYRGFRPSLMSGRGAVQMKRYARYALVVFLSLALAACAELQRYETRRTVEDNIFQSSFPELKVRVDPSLGYLGKAEHTTREASPYLERDIQEIITSYLFGQSDLEGRLRRGVIIRLAVVRGDPAKARKDLSSWWVKNPLDSGIVRILDDEYAFLVSMRADVFAGEEMDILPAGSGLVTAPRSSRRPRAWGTNLSSR